MERQRKLDILTDAAKSDAACASSGTKLLWSRWWGV
jgi:predicted DNA-binding helix-hairpin-helix protein